jgi:hypothetical protein
MPRLFFYSGEKMNRAQLRRTRVIGGTSSRSSQIFQSLSLDVPSTRFFTDRDELVSSAFPRMWLDSVKAFTQE